MKQEFQHIPFKERVELLSMSSFMQSELERYFREEYTNQVLKYCDGRNEKEKQKLYRDTLAYSVESILGCMYEYGRRCRDQGFKDGIDANNNLNPKP